MRVHLLLASTYLIAACGGSSGTKPETVGNTVAKGNGKETRGFDEYPEEYGADEYGEFPYDYGYDEGYYDEGYYGGEGYGGDYTPVPVAPTLSGTWNAACAPGMAKGDFHKLGFVFTPERWDLTIEQYRDDACATRKSMIHLGGTYQLGEASTTVTGAWNGVFSYDVRELTADDKKTATALGKTCGVKKPKAGTAMNLLEKGCPKLGFKPLADCAADHDLVALDGDRVRFGVRPEDNDLCTEAKRPTALDTAIDIGFLWPSTGTPECDAYLAVFSAYSRCASMPIDGRNANFESFRSMGDMMKGMDVETCKTGVEQSKPMLAQMGC